MTTRATVGAAATKKPASVAKASASHAPPLETQTLLVVDFVFFALFYILIASARNMFFEDHSTLLNRFSLGSALVSLAMTVLLHYVTSNSNDFREDVANRTKKSQ